jgi:ATP-binding cassette subfamily F protein uup
MSLLTLRNLHHAFGGAPLFDGADFTIESGERVCLVGRNGTGKSTLLKLISGAIHADEVERVQRQGLRIAELAQEVPAADSGTIFDVVAGGLGDIGEVVKQYHQVSIEVANGDMDAFDRMDKLQRRLENEGGWDVEQRTEMVISRLSLDGDLDFAGLSGGMKRRVMLARALVQEPDVLLLDEPTNHLDIAAIDWLEEFLLGYKGTLLFITHDRAFLRRLATRIIDLERGRLTSWPGDFENYLRRKQEALEAEAQQNALFDKRLAQEEIWIRQGIKARRTRNEGRVRALKKMRDERSQRRERQGNVNMRLSDSISSGKLVVEAEGITYAWDGEPVVRNLTTTIMRGDRVGIIGPNGCGKSTLLRLLLGDLEPQEGTIKRGTNLEIAYFDQMRAQLNEAATVIDTVGQGREQLMVAGKQRHVISYMQDFLFSPERARSPIRSLSGGERNRLLLAKLFLKPANLLVMDEPTNDLDVETLELLEELLQQFEGTLILVSHDRAFLDNVVTSSLVFEGRGRIGDYVGGYSDWLRQRAKSTTSATQKSTKPVAEKQPTAEPAKKKKLSYMDQRALEELPALIERLENEQSALTARLGDPALYQTGGDDVAETNARLQKINAELDDAYARWEALEE